MNVRVCSHCPTPATQKPPAMHIVPTPATQKKCLPHACHTKKAETQATPARTSDSLAARIVPRLPRKRGGDPGDARAWQCTLSRFCHTKEAEPRDTRGTPEGRQGVYIRPLGNGHCPAPAAKAVETKGHQRDARADARVYIRPLDSGHCPTPTTQRQRRPRDTRGTPEGHHGVHPTP